MSEYTNYDAQDMARIFDQEMRAVGADVIAGLLHVHRGKPLKDLHVLDAGCGSGRYAKALVDLGVGNVSLLDASVEMLRLAKENLKGSRQTDSVGDKGERVEEHVRDIIEAKLPTLPFQDGTFDAVMYNYVLQDLEKPENRKVHQWSAIETTLRNTKRILKPKGLVVIATSMPEMLTESIWYTQIYPPIAEKLAKYFPTSKDWADLFAKCGFEVVSATNSLIPDMKNHFDSEGPLREEWRLGSCVYACADEEERKALLTTIADLNKNGLLKKFMEDHDRTTVVGMTTFYIIRALS